MKVFFIGGFFSEILKTNGVAKKIDLEIRTLKSFGFQVDYTEFSDGKIFVNQNGLKLFVCRQKATFHQSMISLFERLRSGDFSFLLSYDLFYYRYEHISLALTSYFKNAKRKNINLKILAELPTYMKKWSPGIGIEGKVKFVVKRMMDQFLPKHFDYIVTFSDHDFLFRTPTIKIENFVDVEQIPLRKPVIDETVDLLALAQLTPSHGFDRVIEGLRQYYEGGGNRKVKLHIVGDGDVRKHLQQLVVNYNLTNKVEFYGNVGGAALSRIFDKVDLGIGSLAFFRKGTLKGSELKVREYTARGLPFIYSAEEPQLFMQTFCKKVAFDESHIDIKDLIMFYDNCSSDFTLKYRMRKFAEQEFTCKKQFSKILKTINLVTQ